MINKILVKAFPTVESVKINEFGDNLNTVQTNFFSVPLLLHAV